MPRQSYNLPRQNTFTSKALTSNSEVDEHKPVVSSSPRLTVPLDETNVVSTEPPVRSLSRGSADNGERDWVDGLCACSHDKSHCQLLFG